MAGWNLPKRFSWLPAGHSRRLADSSKAKGPGFSTALAGSTCWARPRGGDVFEILDARGVKHRADRRLAFVRGESWSRYKTRSTRKIVTVLKLQGTKDGPGPHDPTIRTSI